jgi:hypothetical protein
MRKAVRAKCARVLCLRGLVSADPARPFPFGLGGADLACLVVVPGGARRTGISR